MIKGHKIELEIEIKEFLDWIRNIKEADIITTKHTFFRLKEGERKVFKDRIIKEYILSDTPILVGKQYNGSYAVFYNYYEDVLKLILDIQPNKINVVTFCILDSKQLPKIR